jgi:fructose-1,6-bisphosphatase/inositol monophosphatase family enzyme
MSVRVDIDEVTRHIREVAQEHILPYFRNLKDGQVSYKIGDDPVTIADKEAESALSTRLLGLLDGSKVVGEEAFAANNGILDRFSSESPVWIIDPVDGTRNFAKGNAEYGVLVALSKQNQILAGWIYDPTSDEVITAEKGSGAYYKGQKLKVLPSKPLSEMSGALSPRIIEPYQKAKNSKGLAPVFEEMRAGAHEYPRLVIDGPHFGKADPKPIHFRAGLIQTNAWDDAAGVLIHNEAGGYAATWREEPYGLTVFDHGLLLAPDVDSWHAIKNWAAEFCELPVG